MADQLPTRFAPGRYGKTEGRPGVQVRERHIGLLASVIARRGAAPAAAAAIERLPDRAALTVLGVGPGHWWIESAASARSADDLQTEIELGRRRLDDHRVRASSAAAGAARARARARCRVGAGA